jgi:hypothetical protein
MADEATIFLTGASGEMGGARLRSAAGFADRSDVKGFERAKRPPNPTNALTAEVWLVANLQRGSWRGTPQPRSQVKQSPASKEAGRPAPYRAASGPEKMNLGRLPAVPRLIDGN